MTDGNPRPIDFDKYRTLGAYHWSECNRRSRNYNPTVEARYEIVRRRIPSASRVLDVGCGDGYLMGLLAASAALVVGIDSEASATLLSRAKLHGRGSCELITGSSYELPFADGAFDRVVMTDVVEHLEAPMRSLSEARRVLADDGEFVLTTPKWRPDRRWDPRHVKEYRPDEVRELLSPLFGEVSLTFFWPLRWSNFYRTKLGWRLVKVIARHAVNPFLRQGNRPEEFGQILAICRGTC